jgi:anti-anti-sigma factor
MPDPVVLEGEYDISRTAELRDAILDAHREQQSVVVDMSGVTFFDSSAVRALLEVRSVLATHDATVILADPSPVVRRLLDLTDIGHLFEPEPASAAPDDAPPIGD